MILKEGSMATRNTSLYGIATGVLMAAAFAATSAFAQGKPATAPGGQPPKKDDKVDISDLENKYWAPKDTDFSVVQNRTYTKDKRFFGTLHFGRPVNDQWSSGNVFGVSGNYFWSERFGVQATWLKTSFLN